MHILFLALVLIHSVYANNFPALDGQKAIYGKDDRSFVNFKSSSMINELSKSIALIISKESVDKKIILSTIEAQLLSNHNGINLCLDEKFANHHTLNSCTGFLIAPDLVASAGHCFMNSSDCENKLIAFNVRLKNEVSNGYEIFNRNVYECSEIVSNVFDSSGLQDYAIIRLKKKVKDFKPLKLRSKGTVTTYDKVFMIGHPMGLPLVVTNSTTINDNSNEYFFKATLNSFEGNSGSPVFNARTFEVEGILVRGEEDFIQNQPEQCYLYQVYEQGTKEIPTIKGEGVNRINVIQSFVKAN